MSTWELLAWAGNGCCFARSFLQWWASERAGRTVAPKAFWWLSLCASVLLAPFALEIGEPILLVGYFLQGAIYARNLAIAHAPGAGARLPMWPSLALAASAAAALVYAESFEVAPRLVDAPLWVAVGALGQGLWSSRFVVQWWCSERRGRSHFPAAFWWLSLAGNALLLAYALRLGEPVFIAAFLPGPIVQVRNLALLRRARRASAPDVAGELAAR
jgi:lipid-A-disaccharide synthase-like uncharacterized protein